MKHIPSFAKFSNVLGINSSNSMVIFNQYHNFDPNLAKTCDNLDFIYPQSTDILHVYCTTCAKVHHPDWKLIPFAEGTKGTSIPILHHSNLMTDDGLNDIEDIVIRQKTSKTQ